MDRFSISVFLIDVFRPRNRSCILPSDRLLLVLNKDKFDENGEITKPTGWGMPGGQREDDEHYIDAAYRELAEETGIKKVTILNRREVFLFKQGVDRESEPEEKNGKLVRKTHWHLTVGARLLVPDSEVAIATGKEDIAMADWYRFDQLPKNLYFKHGKRITELYARIEEEKLFNEIFKA